MALTIPLLDSWNKRLAASGVAFSGPLRYALPFLLFSLTIQTALLPLTINAFNINGLLFFLNFIWLPVLGFLVMPLGFAGLALAAVSLAFDGALWSRLAEICFNVAAIPCELLFSGLSRLDAAGLLAAPVALRPAWPAILGFWLLLLCLPWFAGPAEDRNMPRRPLLFAGFALLLMLAPEAARFAATRQDAVRLRLLDVGQGQAVLLEWPGGGRMLLDGGGFSGAFDVGRGVIVPALTDNRPPDLDWIINSHPDTDHLGGLIYPLQTMRVARFGHNGPAAASEALILKRDAVLAAKAVPVTDLAAGDAIGLSPELRLEVLHPPPAGAPGRALSGNNAALVLRAVWRGRPLALICGDVEKAALRRMRESGMELRAPVLVLPHHGSASSLDPAFYSAVNPRIALVSCGYANQWHFPAARVRAALAAQGIPLESTAERGQIAVEWREPERYAVDYARQPAQAAAPYEKEPVRRGRPEFFLHDGGE
jgi:competence protein ComEC